MPVKKTRKKRKGVVSAYNRHVGREMRAGKTMKQAAASWKGKGSKRTVGRRTVSKPKRRTTTSKRRTRKVNKGFNMGKIKSLIRLVSSVVPTAVIVMDPNLDNVSKAKRWVTWHTGWRIDEQRWDPAQLLNGYGPRIGAEVGTRADTIVRKLIRMIG